MVCLAQIASESSLGYNIVIVRLFLTSITPATNKQPIVNGKGVSISQSHYYNNHRSMHNIHELVDINIHYIVITLTYCCIFT